MHSLTHMLWLKVQGISVAHFSKTLSSLRHVFVTCAFHSFPSCRFISYLFSVTTFNVIDNFGEDKIKPPRLRSLEWNVWLLGQSDSSHRFRAQHLCLHQRRAHADQLPCPRNDDATIISTTEDPEGFQHSGASSSSKHTAASRVPTVLGSSGNGFWKEMADCEEADSRNCIRETSATLDRESVVSTLFRSE